VRTVGLLMSCEVKPAVRDVLVPEGNCLPLEMWDEQGWLDVVKTGRHRTVYRLRRPDTEGGGEWYLKRYRAADWKARLRRCLRGATACRESRAMCAVEQLGIATADVVAVLGPRCRGIDRDSWLVTAGVPGAVPLDEWLADHESDVAGADRRSIVRQVAEMMARMHDGGLWHGDLHAGNFLVQPSDVDHPGARWRLVLIDMYPVSRRRATVARRLKALAALAAAFGPAVTLSERWIFLDQYLSASSSLTDDAKSHRLWAEAWQPLYARRRDRNWKRRDRHWSRGNRRLLIADSAMANCRGLACLGRRQLEHLRDRLAAVPPPEGTSVPLATGRGLVMTRILRCDQSVPSARSAWELGHALWRRGLPVVRPWLFVETDRHGLLAIPVPRQAVPLADWPARESLSEALERLKQRVADAGVAADQIGQDQLLVDPDSPDRPLLLLPTWNPAARPLPQPNSRLSRAAAWILVVLSVLAGGCLRATRPDSDPPVKHSVQAERFLLLSDVPLRKDHWLIDDLDRLERQVVSGLGLPEPSRQVVVHVFANRREYEQFLSSTYPQLPSRRAYFVGTPGRLAVYTFWGDRIQEDLRHEFTHGILHSSLKRVPLWLDEGLAEYFEVVGPKPGGVNTAYADRLAAAVANGWRPDLDRLEGLEHVADMQRVDYEQAWAWVHFLLHGHPKGPGILREYLADLAKRPYAGSLGRRIRESIPDADAHLVGYVGRLPTMVMTPTSRVVR